MNPSEPIAIVGIGCRFPGGCDTPSKLWDFLCSKRDAQSRIPTDRFNADAFYHEDGERPGFTNVKHAYVLSEDIREFDASFFKTNPREAESMDPQQRMLLETVYEALESAGARIEALQGSDTAVYVGSMTGDYHELLLRDPTDMPKYMATGTARSILSNRISYFFDWRGPSMTIDTACSSSLVAVHEAVQALRLGSSRVACAAGANLILGPEMMISESKLHMLSPAGRSRMWDAAADGYARGEGFGAVLLKTLSSALADGDFIHCVIRETGVNSDGRTNGITLPSAESQAALIRQTYARAGLDWIKDRCQFFEAHGTGTPAGDPIEARAIHDAFFPDGSSVSLDANPMFVGSVKTGIGHLEGCAGLAGLIKAAEAVRRGIIPPNMLFEHLNPAIEKYYGSLKIATEPQPWPSVEPGAPRRASVNSFGFGGTNSHAIIESFDSEQRQAAESDVDGLISFPLVFSANSESSLKAQVAAHAVLIKSDNCPPLQDLAYTLHSRRSQLPIRAHFSSSYKDGLIKALESAASSESTLGTRVDSKITRPRLLGVFTGQGAQWPTMGRELLKSSPLARRCMRGLEASLSSLPDPPSWTLTEQCLADPESSRLTEAAIAQPLCTAIQIILVDLLATAGITFSTVVGHSSGEIAAAYAAGAITAAEAIRIAHYRGAHAALASSSAGQGGAMLAAGLSYDAACDLCEQQQFAGRIDVAAWNAPRSVTLSGDAAAVAEAKALLDGRGVFARLLKVDTAYHSHHMRPCSAPYVRSLRACGIQPRPPRTGCVWFSSVLGERVEGKQLVESLACDYWRDNLVNPVLFNLAVELAAQGDFLCDAAVEVGPHPALKGPFTQTYQQTINLQIPYQGTLSRDKHDVEALGDTLGFLWARLGTSAVNFSQYAQAFSDTELSPRFLSELPKYCWDHSQKFWKESRRSANFRKREQGPHPLLGVRSPDDVGHELRWYNTLRLQDLPWLDGHVVEGQVIFPAAAYLVMAMEASGALLQNRTVELLELCDVVIANAIPLQDDDIGAQTMFTLKSSFSADSDFVDAEWSCFSPAGDSNTPWRRNASGKLRLTLRKDAPTALPPRVAPATSLSSVDADRFYECLADIGLQYTGLFKRLETIKRKSGIATATTTHVPTTAIIHPALLDSAFQLLFAAFCWPGDGTLSTPFVPTSIRSLRLVNREHIQPSQNITVDAYVTESATQTLAADIELFDSQSSRALMQLEGLTCTSLTRAGPKDYKELYTKNVWELDIGSGVASLEKASQDASQDVELVDLCERLAYYYLRQLNSQIHRSEVPAMEWHFQRIFEWIDHLFPLIESGRHPTIKGEWAADEGAWLLEQASKHPDQVDLQLIAAVGENLAAAARKETTILEHMVKDDVLNRFYKLGLGFQRANGYMGGIVRQITHRYPRMHILEVGAGTGGATKSVLEALGTAFATYTFTDISTGFFEAAADAFAPWAHKMAFRPLNAEEDVVAQGYEEGAYDLVVASNVLHATKTLAATLRNVRRLLRPGGRLLLLEVTSDIVRVKLMMAGLPGWWLGGDDGRRHGPTISAGQWNTVLRDTGFSGVDAIVHDFADASKHMTSVMLTQATDADVAVLRAPLAAAANPCHGHAITIVGGRKGGIAALTAAALTDVPGASPAIHMVGSLAELTAQPPATALVLLEDLDAPVLRDFSRDKLAALQRALPHCRQMLWVGAGCRSRDPHASMAVGLCRALAAEYPHVLLQHLDLESPVGVETGRLVAEAMARLVFASSRKRPQDWLWTVEPELRLENGGLYVPRVLPDRALNDRLNAAKMPIFGSSTLRDSVVDVSWSNGRYVVSDRAPSVGDDQAASHVQVRVSHALLHPLKVSGASVFLCYGHILNDPDKPVLVISESNSSVVSVPVTRVFEASASDDAVSVLRNAAFTVLTETLLRDVNPNLIVALNEPDTYFGTYLTARATELGITTISISGERRPGTVFVHQRSSHRTLKEAIPSNIGLFIDFTLSEPSRWKRVLPLDCPFVGVDELFVRQSTGDMPFAVPNIFKSLGDFESSKSLTPEAEMNLLRISELAEQPVTDAHYSTVIDFSAPEHITTLTRPINETKLFRADRTYLLAGCTGGLGRALCSWMVSKGAKHLALTTRNPAAVDKLWLEELRSSGAQVALIGADIADMDALQASKKQIDATMPPVAGVANAAMVLSDRSFGELKAEDFAKVFGPKVKGTQNLDQLFHDTSLDFFIMFSSLASIVGNRGQSNYVTANLFMTTIAEQRRERGLAASVFHIGMVLGVGYVSSTGIYESTLRQYNYMPISEPEFLNMFSQAILVGRPKSGHSPESITGLSRHSLREDAQKPFWHENLRFSHHTIEETHQKDTSSSSNISLLQQISEATSADEIETFVQDAFCVKLERMLQAAAGTIERSLPLMNLGVDSLIAVEIRSWFLKELDVDLPVLKVLGGASVADLSREAASKFQVTTSVQPAEKVENVPHIKVTETEAPARPITSSDSSDASPSPAPSMYDVPSTTASHIGSPKPEQDSLYDLKSRDQLCVERVAPMSFAQERLWFLLQYLRDPTTYNVTISYRVNGPLRLSQLEDSFRQVIERHESLRTCFYADVITNDPTQAVVSDVTFRLEVNPGVSLQDAFSSMQSHVFDLENGQTFKAVVIPSSAQEHLLVVGFHHIAFDGFSAQILVKDLAMAYNGMPLGPLQRHYVDFAIEEREQGWNGSSNDVEYWKSEFKTLPPTLPLFDFTETKTRLPVETYKIRSVQQILPSQLATIIKATSRKLGATPFHIHLATLQVLLHRMLSLDDVCIGITDANKNDPEYLETIGFFVNLLPIRCQVDAAAAYADIVTRARNKAHDALSHSRTPFDHLLDILKVPRSTSHSPLFQVMLNYKMGSTQVVPLGDCKAELVRFEDAGNAFDLNFEIESRSDGSTLLAVKTQEYLYTDHDLHAILRSYVHFLSTLIRDPVQKVGSVPLATSSDVKKAVQLGRGGRTASPELPSISLFFDRWVTEQPNATCVKNDSGARLTYAEVAARANAIADKLVQAGAKPGDNIAVYCEPSIDVACSLLAIHRLGCAYVPMDTQNPVERLEHIVNDCRPAVVLCDDDTKTAAVVFETYGAVIPLSSVFRAQGQAPNVSTGAGVACVMYTSGTTGKPKGVMVTQSNLVHHIAAVSKKYKLAKEVILQQTSLGFDLSLAQMCQSFYCGGTLVVASKQTRKDPPSLSKLMRDEEVTYTWMTPTEASSLIRYGHEDLKHCTEWRHAFTSGESFSTHLLGNFEKLGLRGLRLYNGFGPTEITINSCIGDNELDPETARDTRNPSIGKTLENYSSYVLSKDMQLVPTGLAGELCVGGAGVAGGYRQRPDLNAERFIDDPFATPEDIEKGWTKLYRTGDKAKFLPDGRLVFLGRIDGDSQVKMRGFRIELDDIANSIVDASDGAIVEAAVSLRQAADESQSFLAAFAISSQSLPEDEAQHFLEQLRRRLPLPLYMIPAVIVPIQRLPVNAAGKLDKRALNALPLSLPTKYRETEELTDLQRQLKGLWLEVLPEMAQNISLDTSFFDAGGNSSLLMKLKARINQDLDTNISIFDLFMGNTLGGMADKFNTSATSTDSSNIIDWDEETDITHLLPPPSSEPTPEDDPRTRTTDLEVILTGATGFIGTALLRRLAADPRVSKIHCIAIRRQSATAPSRLSVRSAKIVEYPGDLAHPRLGLSEQAFAALSGRAHRVVHNAAAVSFLRPYRALRAANVGATKGLLALAAPRRVPLHFVSSAGVLRFAAGEQREGGLRPVSLRCGAPPPPRGAEDAGFGYAASKWVGEVVLEKGVEAMGGAWPVVVHRVASVVGEGVPASDLMGTVLGVGVRVGALPDVGAMGWRGAFDFVPVEEVAGGICEAACGVGRGGEVRFVHHCAEEKIEVGGIREWVERKYGVEVALVGLDRWFELARENAGMDGMVEAMVRKMLKGEGGVIPLLLKR